jgi:hypothetical protein
VERIHTDKANYILLPSMPCDQPGDKCEWWEHYTILICKLYFNKANGYGGNVSLAVSGIKVQTKNFCSNKSSPISIGTASF